MKDSAYQDIVSEIDSILPYAWDELVIRLEDSKSAWSYVFYVKSDNEFTQCYDIPGLSEDAVDDAFEKIRGLVEGAREQKYDWKELTIHVSPNGKFKATFDYDDHTNDAYEHSNQWKDVNLV